MKVWVLVDNRIGTAKQAKSLAQILGLPFKIKKLQYSFLAKLPNFLKFRFLDLKAKSRAQIKSGKPDVIISAGRRSAAVAVQLKKIHPKVKIIQIMQGSVPSKFLDILILPQHDKKQNKKYSHKTIFIDGAISFLESDELVAERRYWQERFKDYKKPYVCLLIGGKSRHTKFTGVNAKKLMQLAINFAKKKDASLMISTSRRTPAKVVNIINEILVKESHLTYYLYDPNHSNDVNPYKGFLAIADYILVTADSVSMCSEAIETHKPVYAFFMPNMLGRKHEKFVTSLILKSYVQPLTEEIKPFENKAESRHNTLREKIFKLLKINE